MSGILFIVPGSPLVFNYSGAASRYAQNFLALQSLGEEVHVLRFHTAGQLQSVLDFESSSETAQNARRVAASWQDVEIPDNRAHGRLDIVSRMLFDSLTGEFPQAKSLACAIQARIRDLASRLLWVEHSDCAAAAWRAAPAIPWIYSHHDMRYLIRARRAARSGLLETLQAQLARRIEIQIIRKADVVLTGSSTEQKRLEQLTGSDVMYIPMIYPEFPVLQLDAPAGDLRATHIGSLETTANRVGLSSYLSLAHPSVWAQTGLPLTIVGNAERVKPPLSELLLQPGVSCAGYVADLGTVLRPYDVSILPYPQDSGYRTKLPMLMGYAQVIVATRAAVAGSLTPGLEDVCILLDRVEDFPRKIIWLAAHPEERKRLGLAGRAFAERHFSLEAVRPLYAELLSRQPADNRTM